MKDVPVQFEADRLERDILQFWETDKTFERSLALRQTQGKKPFVFYDGPPYATGKPHYGHILQSALKDTVLRYKTMRGFHVPRRVGWDTHGLPVEVLVEKELGLKTKREVEEYGMEKFNEKCREAVFRYMDEFRTILQRVGRWASYDNEYATLDREYMEREWGVFKALWEKKLVYKDFRSTPYCVRCATPLSNFETSMAYRDKTDKAVYVRLRVSPTSRELRGANQEVYLLIWTTTPWTLPANVAVAVSKDIRYVSIEQEGEEYIVAKDRVKAIFGENAQIIKEWKSEDLLGLTYEGLYPMEAPYRVVAADHVTAQDGTGLVHMAPAFGMEDFETGKREQLPVLRTVDTDGRYTIDPTAPGDTRGKALEWGGKSIWRVNDLVIEDLQQRGLLFKEEKYKHSYPHCWRCDQPLIYYALDSWFIKVTDLKEKMLAANESIHWIPEHIKHGRFAKGIESAPDWAVSRNRFWSTPMPVWECDVCHERTCVGSVEELQALTGEKNTPDLHRPYVDRLTWRHTCGGQMIRIPEVLDVWFDAGSMPYATGADFPADFIVESIEMTRAWFYVMHVLAVALKGEPAYKHAIGSGIIFGADGNKLSKKLKNYPDIEPTIQKYGADTVRMFFLGGTLGEPYVFDEKELQQLYRNFTMRLWNVYGFFVRYANTAGWEPVEARQHGGHLASNVLDKWILARLKQLESDVIVAAEEYRFDAAARAFMPFVDELSNWYVRRSRDRFQPKGGEPDEVAFQTLHEVLVRLSTLLAPFTPFLSESIYSNLVGKESVHLQTLADAPSLADEERKLLQEMTRAREAASQGLALRAQAKIKVRQPLRRLTVPGQELAPELTQIIAEEVNVKAVKFEGGEAPVQLDIQITEELKAEGLAREIIRHGQQLRRQAAYDLGDKIQLVYVAGGQNSTAVFEAHRENIMRALQAISLVSGEAGPEDAGDDFDLAGETVHLGVKK